jgi:hypothetical protein
VWGGAALLVALPGFTLHPFTPLDPDLRAKVYLDGTPDYMQIPAAACRIRSLFPNARLLVLLKDPAMRAFSAWNMLQVRA